MAEVAGATSLPVLMLGGDPGAHADATFARWENAMREPNVRGLVAGRALLYPHSADPEDAVRRASSIVHGGTS
jgi:DhnA family fructose-bisphosphate aldolase class Ia